MWTRCSLGSVGLVLLWCGLVTAQPGDREQALRDRVLQADTYERAGKAYQECFQHLGVARLRDRLKDKETGIALQAAWEVHKKAGKRAKPIDHRTDYVYDRAELERFLAFVKERTQAPVPAWWAETIVNVDLFPGRHHAFIESPKSDAPKLRKAKARGYVPEGAELEGDDGTLVYTTDGRAVEFPKSAFDDEWLDDGIAGLVGEKRSVIANYQLSSGFAFKLVGFEGKGGKPSWKADVWAAGRTGLGGSGHDWVELNEKAGSVFVVGAESHGMYLEAFDATTGKCQFRFCTCYWFNQSERWDLK